MKEASTHKVNSIQDKESIIPNANQLQKAIFIFRAIKNPLRRKMLLLMHRYKRIAVSDIYERLHLEQSVASNHLAILRKAGLVATKRYGKFIYYSMNYNGLKKIQRISNKLV